MSFRSFVIGFVVVLVLALSILWIAFRPDPVDNVTPSPAPAPIEETTVEEPVNPPTEPGVIQYGELPNTGGPFKVI